jgi:hypothetical protein
MDIWVNPKIEENLRKEGWDIPVRPKQGPIFYNGTEVGISDNFIGLRIRDHHTDAIKFCVKNESRLNLCLWNIPDNVSSSA